MTVGGLSRFDIVQCVVTGHRHYGLLVLTESGEAGFVDKSDIADGGSSDDEWPIVGNRIECVFLGYARDGRIRAASIPSYVRLIRELDDPGQALGEWRELREVEASDEFVKAFLRSRHARPLLRWGLANPAGSVNHALATRLLSIAPDVLE